METKQLESESDLHHIAKAKINRDVIVLYMIAKKYKLDLLSLLALYEIYDKDVFLFFYILSGSLNSEFMGKSLAELELGSSLAELPKESNLKLMFTKAQKVSDALRRNSDVGLTSVTLPYYNALKPHCEGSHDKYINFFSVLRENREIKISKARKSPQIKKKEKVQA